MWTGVGKVLPTCIFYLCASLRASLSHGLHPSFLFSPFSFSSPFWFVPPMSSVRWCEFTAKFTLNILQVPKILFAVHGLHAVSITKFAFDYISFRKFVSKEPFWLSRLFSVFVQRELGLRRICCYNKFYLGFRYTQWKSIIWIYFNCWFQRKRETLRNFINIIIWE